MSQKLDVSIDKIDRMVVRKLSDLKRDTQTQELENMNKYLEELKKMKEKLMAISCGPETSQKEIEWELADLFIESCNLIVALYSLIDYKKLDEADMDWVCNNAEYMIGYAQQLFGPQIPDLPIIYLEKALDEAINR